MRMRRARDQPVTGRSPWPEWGREPCRAEWVRDSGWLEAGRSGSREASGLGVGFVGAHLPQKTFCLALPCSPLK
jgi:hypothetical protein